MIHKSHSKNELVKIITIFKIDIINPKKYRKVDLSDLLNDKLKLIEDIEPSEDMCLYNITDLKYYLSNINPKKRLTIKEKNHVIHICKKIKHLYKNGFLICASEYNNINEVFKDADYICNYGDIPSVRKAIRDLNKCDLVLQDYKPIISDMVKKELDTKIRMKKTNQYKCEFKHGHFVLKFD
tara:strand:- start:1747 stop:2292 length:546 start_codon:yes stop_codon:yes gene_type:complete